MTSGYRRQRRKHGRKGWPSRRERRLCKLLTIHANWYLRKVGLVQPWEHDAIRVVPQ